MAMFSRCWSARERLLPSIAALLVFTDPCVARDTQGAGLLGGNPDWGRPPKENAPTRIPDLPAVQGWYWLLGSGYPALLEVSADVVITGRTGLLAGLDPGTGEQLWQTDRYYYPRDVHLLNDVLIFSIGQDVVALNPHTGTELWRTEGEEQVLVTSPSGTWFTNVPTYEDPWERREPNFTLIDPYTGKKTHRLEIPRVFGIGIGTLEGEPQLVVKAKGEFVICSPQLAETRVPAAYETSPAWIGIVDGGFVAAEYGRPYTDEARQLPVVLSAYDLPTGDLRWRQQLSPDMSYSFQRHASRLLNQHFLAFFADDSRLKVLSLADGSVIYTTAYEASAAEPCLEGSQIGYFDREGQRIQLVDLQSRSEVTALQSKVEPRGLRLKGERLYFLNDNRTLGGKFDSVYAAWSLELKEGVVQPGQLQVLNAPTTPDELIAAFFATDPLEDPALMRQVVMGGSNQILDLLARTGPETPAQLDALLAAATYSTEHRLDTYVNSSNALEALIDTLSERVTPEYAAQIIRWLEDPSLAKIHHGLLGLLAHAGGPEASAWLDKYYEQFLQQQFEPPSPPFMGCLTEEYTTRVDPFETRSADNTLVKRTYLDPVSAAGNKAEYELFSSPALGFERDLFIGVKNPEENGYSELLYTGLTDIFFITAPYHSYRTEINRRGPVRITVAGDKVVVSHHEPIYTTKTWDSGGTYTDFSDTRYVRTPLSLKVLRQDTDQDGLTDKLESRLRTNPNCTDSDGDGIPDAHDRMPNVNPARWGPVERGIARALVYHFREAKVTDKDECGRVPPLRARYFTVPTEVPVAIAIGAGYSVWTAEEPQVATSISASWDENAAGWRYAWGSEAFGEEVKALVHLGRANMGLMTTLVEISGEYYPVSEGVTSIAD